MLPIKHSCKAGEQPVLRGEQHSTGTTDSRQFHRQQIMMQKLYGILRPQLND